MHARVAAQQNLDEKQDDHEKLGHVRALFPLYKACFILLEV